VLAYARTWPRAAPWKYLFLLTTPPTPALSNAITPSDTMATWILFQVSWVAFSTVRLDIFKICPVANLYVLRYVPVLIGLVTSTLCHLNVSKHALLAPMVIRQVQIATVSLNATAVILVFRLATDNVWANVLLAPGDNLTT